jgi:DNA-binding transcriptional MerR regulator
LLTRVGDVARELGVPDHVVRYWSDQFGVRPGRQHGGHRVYSERNVARLKEIQRLLKEEKLTIAGAKARLERKVVKEDPGPDGKTQYCPHCGLEKEVGKQLASFCKCCGKRVTWTGPLWGSK